MRGEFKRAHAEPADQGTLYLGRNIQKVIFYE